MVYMHMQSPEHAESYEAIRINWRPGHAPQLHIFDDGEKTQVIDIAEHTVSSLHELLADMGFVRSEPEDESEKDLLAAAEAAEEVTAEL
jgi:hypothetical protein